MAIGWLTYCVAIAALLHSGPAWGESVKEVVAEASYVMGDADTLASAEHHALLRAKRKAVEAVGVYVEASSQNIETYSGGKTRHLTTLSVRTLAAAVTQTEILDRRRTLDGDRLVFYVKIKATVSLDRLAEAIRRQKAYEQLATHYRQLQTENSQLKTQLERLSHQLEQRNIEQGRHLERFRSRRTARELTRSAIRTHSLSEKIDLASRAIAADDHHVEAYIIRGQTYLGVASLTYSKKDERAELNMYAEKAIQDFSRALQLEPVSTWAYLGRGDALTWQKKIEEAIEDYERILQIDPLFDVARQRLITLYTRIAVEQAASRQWRPALKTLERALKPDRVLSWVAYQKQAYLLRSQVYSELGQLRPAIQDLTTVLQVDPNNLDALLQRADLYRRLTRAELAKQDFERACALGSVEACF